jgi:hypothetical protein
MIRVVILSPDVKTLSGNAKISGKPYTIRIQTGHAFTVAQDGSVGEYPDKFEFFLEDGQPPYAKGHYTVQPSALTVSRDGKMQFLPRLAPVPAGKA